MRDNGLLKRRQPAGFQDENRTTGRYRRGTKARIVAGKFSVKTFTAFFLQQRIHSNINPWYSFMVPGVRDISQEVKFTGMDVLNGAPRRHTDNPSQRHVSITHLCFCARMLFTLKARKNFLAWKFLVLSD
mgnify:CR=1 FL=1